jgi:Zn-dependent protease
MKCEYCGRDESLPFVCNYCGGAFCADHRLPEAHQCKGDLTQKRMVIPPPQTTFSWSDTPTAAAPEHVKGRIFSAVEIRDIIIAWVGLGVAFTISLQGGASSLYGSSGANVGNSILVFVISMFVLAGFVLHELSHKFVAQNYGFWAEFRMWPFGLILALATSLLGFIFAAPGATYISGVGISKPENGKISIAGPLTNVGVAIVFFPLYLFSPSGSFLWDMGFIGTQINIFLGLFNMLPIMPLDGAKVFAWSKPRWAGLFIPLLVVFALWVALAY